jgi:hypothetical protein
MFCQGKGPGSIEEAGEGRKVQAKSGSSLSLATQFSATSKRPFKVFPSRGPPNYAKLIRPGAINARTLQRAKSINRGLLQMN